MFKWLRRKYRAWKNKRVWRAMIKRAAPESMSFNLEGVSPMQKSESTVFTLVPRVLTDEEREEYEKHTDCLCCWH